VDDRDVEKYLKLFTERARDDIKQLVATQEKDPGARAAQRALATDVTTLVHGADPTRNAGVAAEILFGEFDPKAANAGVFDILAAELPTVQADGAGSPSLVDVLAQTGLAKSKSEARRAIEQGGVYVNQQREKDVDRKIAAGDWLAGGNLLLRKGKKDYALLRRRQ
jgi:tyrosyl-tRNA synthetase